jgi:glyceraldehyde 3-phosphate dehydrogenase
LKGILEYSEEELVSSDFIGDPASAVIDAKSTEVTGKNMVRILAWYDNEWGYCCRMADLADYISRKTDYLSKESKPLKTLARV